MRCSSCGSDNREGRKFCAECGAAAKLGQGDARTALELADEALATARQSGGRLFEIDALLTRARALRGFRGASCAARGRELREGHRLFVEMGATGHAARIAPPIADLPR